MFFKLRIIVIMLLLIGVSVAIAETAAPSPEAAEPTLDQELTNNILQYCNTEFPVIIAAIVDDFYRDLDAVGQNAQVLSQQLESVFASYNKTLTDLNAELAFISQSVDLEASPADAIIAISRCKERYQEAYSLTRQTITSYLSNVSQQKSDLAIIQQYDSLNNSADRLLNELQQTDAFFLKFFNQVPQCTANCAKL